jgi:hypothetical protein
MQNIPLPYGDAYLVGTPAIDRMSQQLYAEQKQRELIRQKQGAALDEEFAKNVANVRDVDVPEITKRYGEWKTANQQLMKNKGGVPPEQQLDLLRKKAEIYKTINASKQGMEEEEEIRKGLMKDPDLFDDNAATYLAIRRKTPISGLGDYADASGKPINLADYNTYRYKGTNTDFSKIERDAAGTPKQVYQEETPLEGGLQFKITPYMYGNTPMQFYQNYLGALSQRKAGRDAEAIASQLKPEMVETIQEQYRNISPDVWKRMGVDKPQELVIAPDDSKAEKLAKHQAQLYALNNQPKQGTPVFRDNKKAIDDQNFRQQKEMEAIRDANAKRRLAIQDSYARGRIAFRKAGSKKDQEGILDGIIERTFDEGVDKKGAAIIKGKAVAARQIAVPADITKTYTVKDEDGKDKAPIKFLMSEDKKYIVPVYPGESTKDREGSYIPIETFRNQLGKAFLTRKDAAAEMGEDVDFGEDEEVEETVSVSAPAQDDSYTREELKGAGWSDDQINKAAKSGKIKVK